MAKNLKINIKNTQIAEALKGLKSKLSSSKEETTEKTKKASQPRAAKAKPAKTEEVESTEKVAKEESPRAKARSKSVFAEGTVPPKAAVSEEKETPAKEPTKTTARSQPRTSGEELRRKMFGEEAELLITPQEKPTLSEIPEPVEEIELPKEIAKVVEPETPPPPPPPKEPEAKTTVAPPQTPTEKFVTPPPYVKLGPTGRHVKDLLPPQRPPQPKPPAQSDRRPEQQSFRAPAERQPAAPQSHPNYGEDAKKGPKTGAKEFRDLKPTKQRQEPNRTFDARDRHGLRDGEEEHRWRKRRAPKAARVQEEVTIRPTALKIRTPISIKDLAAEMKLKASQLIAKLFLQGVIVTLNDLLDDETTIQLLGHEFGCEITIDTSEEQRIRITDKTVREEIQSVPKEQLQARPPVVAFMGHVDHGKTSLIDAIRKSNRASSEAGAITQHIGAFRCHTDVGDITILDTPGHEAFSAMRARGADVTDIVVLVVAGDEGMRQQTLEAVEHAIAAKVTIVVAINKSDKPGFNPENVYRQLAENNLLPEVWGGQVLTVNCSAVTGAGVKELLETLALQTEIMELKADPSKRARGTVIETEMHKGLGAVTTVLVQNGTLRLGDSLVFEQYWGRVKTMRDEFGRNLSEASPSTPVAITGLSGLPEAGQEFIVVKNEREAREIGEARMLGMRQLQTTLQQRKKLTVENLLQQATPSVKKVLNVVLRADVQGSLEALKTSLSKIESTKAEVNVIFAGVGEISESDVQLAATSKAVIIGFHTKIESHAEALIKQHNVVVKLHDIIYHAIDDVKVLLRAILDKIAQENEKGKAVVKALFKSSHAGTIAGCQVSEGVIQRNNHIRIIRNGENVGKASIASLKRVKEDVREVAKGFECGIVLNPAVEVREGDVLEAYDITYITQDL